VHGIDLAAFTAARAQRKLRDDKREAFDRDMLICRKAADIPIAPELFDADGVPTAQAEQPPAH